MKKKTAAGSKDTPATRQKRLQQRLREIDDRNDREMNALMKSIERLKARFRSQKSSRPSR